MSSLNFRNVIVCSLGVVLVVMLTACVSVPKNIPSLNSPESAGYEDAREQALVRKANQAHQSFLSEGLIYKNKTVSEYVNNTLVELLPTLYSDKKQLQVFVLKYPLVNAFAFPNGNIYVTVGLLSSLENQSQLAFVLAHETSHIVNRHSLKQDYELASGYVSANVVDLITLGIGSSSYARELASHSRDQELEADTAGLAYLKSTRFTGVEAEKVIEILSRHSPVMKKDAIAYSTHPETKIRINNIRDKLTDRRQTSRQDIASYADIRKRFVFLNLKLRLAKKMFRLAMDSADDAAKEFPDSAQVVYYKAEAYRLSAAHPVDAAREIAWLTAKSNKELKKVQDLLISQKTYFLNTANRYYRDALQKKELPIIYRGLGLVAYQLNDHASAVDHLQHYLNLKPEARDKTYIEYKIKEIRDREISAATP